MSDDKRHVEFEIGYLEDNKIKIQNAAGTVITEYFEDKTVPRSTMGPADLFFSAFAL